MQQVIDYDMMTVAEMLEDAKTVKSKYETMREESQFHEMFDKFNAMRSELYLEELSLPRARKSPARLCGPAEAFRATSAKQ